MYLDQTWKPLHCQVPSPDLMGPWGTVDRRQLDSIEYWLEHNIGADFVCVDGEGLLNKIIPQEQHEAKQQSQNYHRIITLCYQFKLGKREMWERWLHPGGVGENWEEDWLLGGVLKFREVTHWLKYFLLIIYWDKVTTLTRNVKKFQQTSSWKWLTLVLKGAHRSASVVERMVPTAWENRAVSRGATNSNVRTGYSHGDCFNWWWLIEVLIWSHPWLKQASKLW